MLKTNPPVKRIGLMGPFGFGNLGDAAIQQAMIQNIYKYNPEAEIFGFSLNPEDTERRHGIRSFPLGRMASHYWLNPSDVPPYLDRLFRLKDRLHRSPNRIIKLLGKAAGVPLEPLAIAAASRQLKGMEHFIISGGGQLDDYWGGPTYHPYTMLVWAILARLRKVKLSFVSVGAGPLDHRLSRWFVRGALALAGYRSYRDEDSRNFVRKIGFKRSGLVYPDLAHSLDLTAYQESSARPKKRPLVGVGPMAYFDPRVWPEKDEQVYKGYLAKLAGFITWLLENNRDVLLFPGEAEHDRDVIADLREMLAERGIAKNDPRVLVPEVETLDDLMHALAATDLVVASRFHGVLLAQLLNKPVLAASYHRKIDVLMANTGQAEYCLQISNFEVEALKERFTALENNCQAIKATLAARTGEFRRALEEQYGQLFGKNSVTPAETRQYVTAG